MAGGPAGVEFEEVCAGAAARACDSIGAPVAFVCPYSSPVFVSLPLHLA